MKISIIIPCYNVEFYITSLLESILKQIEKKEVEVICVNDGSTDGTLRVLESFASKISNFQILNQKNGGPASARNRGLEKAKGDYIWFVDGDDVIEKNAIDILIQEIEKNPTDVICFNYNRVEVNGKIVSSENIFKFDYCHIFKGTEAYSKFEIPSYLWNRIIRRELIENNSIRFVFFPEDEDFLMNIYMVTDSFRFIRHCIYNYNDVGGSFSKNVDNFRVYYEGYYRILEKYSSFTKTETNKMFWQRFVWSCVKNVFINYNRVVVGNYRGEIDDRITMYNKIRKHLSVYRKCISYKGYTALFICVANCCPFVLDTLCYAVYKIRKNIHK